eukprot:GHRR01024313.1.p1 GENE.GHRR01024313.1~~GHRR01024313.1.p1  ORF type:complete len:665 (+),score=279.07 GHRR01024313.1:673-2667(+)
MAGPLQQMLMRSQEGTGAASTALVNAYEAEQLIEQLQFTQLQQVGDARFLKQHGAITKLNLQAHLNAQTHSDEFVLELLVSLDKLSVLVQELLVIEVWKEQLYPLLKQHLAKNVDSATSYLVLYHEAAVANLLEVVLYHGHACEAISDDELLELADWCMRKLAYLNTEAHNHANLPERSVQDTLGLSPVQELEEKRAETDFTAALCGLTILRYLTDHITRLPLGVTNRLLGAHDAVMALLPLVEAPPWVRQRKRGKVEKFISSRWQEVLPADHLMITQLDGQVWLCLVNLLVDPACRAKYYMDDYRHSCILKLRRHLNELLLDQLPVLRQLSRVLDEMSLGVSSAAAAAPGKTAGAGSRLILEQVPLLRESLLKGNDWQAIAHNQQKKQFGPAAKQLAKDRLESMLQSFELMCQMEDQQQQQQKQQSQQAAGSSSAIGATPSTGSPGAADANGDAAIVAAPIKVVCSRQLHAGGMWEHWCDITLAIDASKPSEIVSISTQQQTALSSKPTSSQGNNGSKAGTKANGNGATSVHGLRYRLQPSDPESMRALPMKGKVAVHLMGNVAEALVQLPEVPLRNSGNGSDGSNNDGPPAGLWLTVGLLAADGFALQLRLKKADKPKERDRAESTWYAYHPVGGAITVLLPAADTTAVTNKMPAVVTTAAK